MADAATSQSPIEAAEVLRTARETAPDDYLAATLAPLAVRADVITLAAYFGEIARIPLQVSDPGLGEIRLQWWRDALSSSARTGHPVADALRELTARRQILIPLLTPALEARAAELYAEPFPDEAAFEAYLDATETAHVTARWILAAAASLEGPAADVVQRTGRTLAQVRFLVRLPHLLAKGRCPLPASDLAPVGGDQDNSVQAEETQIRRALRGRVAEATRHFAALRPELNRISRDSRGPLIAVALAGPYLRALQGPGHDPLRDVVELVPVERLVRLWWAARWGRF